MTKNYTIKDITDKVKKNKRWADIKLIQKAYNYAVQKHGDQKRKSGEPYIIHPTNVAYTIAELGLDEQTICAALLHDVVEDTDATYDDIKNEFGPEVAEMVDGVTKLKLIQHASIEENQVENYRKMFLAMGKDIRVIIIKLADRLHNMRTLEFLRRDRQIAIAKETMQLYAPLANRLGFYSMKWELEDLSFKYLYPKEYDELIKGIEQKREERLRFIEKIMDDIRQQLKKEHIEAEPEALNVIAQKADGGMRDALSIFDQVVSFTGGHISYKSVIENLNVLDYEYYFRLTDHFLSNQVSDALLLLNDVLNKGFDGSHFITGLSSHCRDLLVSKDAATLPLLEVGASIRQRYQEQAQKCPLQFLYRAMKLCNDCDLNYRASKNKRLLVELTLIQVAQLTIEGDDVSGGRGPKQTIKPVFTQPAAAQQPQVASAPSAQQTTVHTAPSPAIAPSAANTAVRQPQVSVASGAAAPANTASAPSQSVGISSISKEERKIPVMKMSSLGVSIKNPQRDQAAQNTAKTNVAQVQTQPEEDFIFNDRDLNYYWQEYAGQLPKEQVAIAKRMQVIRPVLLNNSTTFEVVVDNEIAAKDFTALIPELQTYLRGRLKNSKVAMKVRVSEPAETVRAVGRVEKFQMMAQKNQALMQLKDEFGLELY